MRRTRVVLDDVRVHVGTAGSTSFRTILSHMPRAAKADSYSPTGLARTSLLLAVPLFVSGICYALAAGMKAGTWPPARSRSDG